MTFRKIASVFFILVVVAWPGHAGLWFSGEEWEPTNVYTRNEPTPIDMRRLAVLPIAARPESGVAEEGRANLSEVLREELRRTAYFDFVFVEESDMERWTGRRTWRYSDELPELFMDEIRLRTGCDAVLFVELAGYQPFPPVSMSWKLSIVDTKDHHTWWSVDETIDSRRKDVERGAQKHLKATYGKPAGKDARISMKSPRRFGHYALSKLLDTLPPR